MTTFAEQIVDDWAEVFDADEFGEVVTYARGDVDDETVVMIFGTADVDDYIENHVYGEVITGHVSESSLAELFSRVPEKGDLVTRMLTAEPGGDPREETWTVRERSRTGGDVWTLLLERNVRIVP